MHDTNDMDDSEEEFSGPSKSEVKRRMTALQEIGESLTRLSEKQLSKVPLTDERLIIAIAETQKIKSNSARKRHLQYIGKLMRDIDAEPIQKALEAMYRQKQGSDSVFHDLEKLRDSILADGPGSIEKLLTRWPQADRQQLRQLVLQHKREQKQNKPATASRRLFKYLRHLQEDPSGGS